MYFLNVFDNSKDSNYITAILTGSSTNSPLTLEGIDF